MKKQELAENYFGEGYNCAQSLVMAFAEEIGLDKAVLAKMSIGLGGGVGRLREVCGAVSGVAMVLGLLCDDALKPESKAVVYAEIQDVAASFKKVNGSIVCKELLSGIKIENSSAIPDQRTEAYYNKRPCKFLVGDAAALLEKFLESKEKERLLNN